MHYLSRTTCQTTLLSRGTKTACIETARQMCIFRNMNADDFGPIFVIYMIILVRKWINTWLLYLHARQKEKYSPSVNRQFSSFAHKQFRYFICRLAFHSDNGQNFKVIDKQNHQNSLNNNVILLFSQPKGPLWKIIVKYERVI